MFWSVVQGTSRTVHAFGSFCFVGASTLVLDFFILFTNCSFVLSFFLWQTREWWWELLLRQQPPKQHYWGINVVHWYHINQRLLAKYSIFMWILCLNDPSPPSGLLCMQHIATTQMVKKFRKWRKGYTRASKSFFLDVDMNLRLRKLFIRYDSSFL